MIKGIESDIDKHMYEYNLIINICKNSYRYFKVIDKIFDKILKIYDESFEKEIVNENDYIKMFKEIYDMMIKTKVNDVHRTISTEDEYLEYSKLLASDDESEVDKFLLEKAQEMTKMESIKEKIEKILNPEEETEEQDEEDIDLDKLNLDEILGKNESLEDEEEQDLDEVEIEDNEDKEEAIEEEKPKRRVGRPRKEEKPKEKRRVGRPKKNK